MVSKDIIDYVKIQLRGGRDGEEIKGALISAGWQVVDIEEAFRLSSQDASVVPMPDSSPYSYQYGEIDRVATTLSPAVDLLKEAWKIYLAGFKTFFGIVLIPVIAIFIFAGIIAAGLFGFEIFSSYKIIIFAVPLLIAIIILQYWGQASLICAAKGNDQKIGIKESYRRGWHKIGQVFWVSLLSGIIIFGGYFLLVIPGIIFGIWFSFAVLIVIAEDLGGMNALLKSKFYVTGYWWEVLWRLIFIGLIVGGISLIFSFPVWIMNLVAGFTGDISLSAARLFFNIFGGAIGLFLAPLTVIYTFLVYKNLKAIKGERTPIFSRSEKIKFVLAGILGILLFSGMTAFPVLLINYTFGSAKEKAMDAARQSDISQIRVSLEMYAIEHGGKYPESLDHLAGESKSLNLSIIPNDPKTDMQYEYRLLKDGKDFELCAELDSGGKKCINRF